MTARPLEAPATEVLNLLGGPAKQHFARRYSLEQPVVSLGEWLEKLRQEPGMLHVAIVGEFNAGKSTLVNALFGRRVAFADPFEATTTTATYLPDSEEYVLVQHQDGRQERWKLPRYLTACEKGQTKPITRAEVHLRSVLCYAIVDTPGMSSVTKIHEERAETAVESADVLVWVIDPNDMGSAKEGAFLKRARKIDLPIVVVLSKADQLSEDDVAECISWLTDRLHYRREQVIALAAEAHTPANPDPGVAHLLEVLARYASNPTATRSRARIAKQFEVREQVRSMLDHLRAGLDKDLRWVDNERGLVRSQASAVKAHLQQVCQDEVVGSLRRHVREQVPETVPEEAVIAVATECLSGYVENRLPAVAERLQQVAQNETLAAWNQQFEDRLHDVKRQIAKLTAENLKDQSTIDFFKQQLEQVAFRQDAVVKTIATTGQAKSPLTKILAMLGWTVATTVTGGSVLWGSAPQVIHWLTSALSGNVLWGLSGAAGATRSYLLGKSAAGAGTPEAAPKLTEAEAAAKRSETIRLFADFFGKKITELVSQHLVEYVDTVADLALNSMCVRHCDGQSIQDLEKARQTAERLGVEVAAV